MDMKYLKSADGLLDRDYVNRRGLDLSIEVLCVSLDQKAAEIPAVKFGGQKKCCCSARFEPNSLPPGLAT